MRSTLPHWYGRTALVVLMAVFVVATATAGPAAAAVTPAQLEHAGWTCIQPRSNPPLLLCAPPGLGLPPLIGTPGFAYRQPSYEFKVFDLTSRGFLGTNHGLRPDIYAQGTPPCTQQPGGEYIYNPRNDLWFCLRTR